MPSIALKASETPSPSKSSATSNNTDLNQTLRQVKRRLSNPVLHGETPATLHTLRSNIDSENDSNEPRYSPLSIPISRRLQTAAVLWHTVSIPAFISFVLFLIGIPMFWIFLAIYIIYNIFDLTPSNGKVTRRYSNFFRDLQIWKYYCQYFPIRLHKTVDLVPTFSRPSTDKPQSNKSSYEELISWINPLNWIFGESNRLQKTGPTYIFGLHPHGVISLSGFGAVGTNGAEWSSVFPGVPVCLMTLLNQFYIPFYRDYLLALGITSSGKENALEILKQGFSLGIVVGGAQESLLAKPDSNDIVLNKRKGFIKLALETGNVGLVPCFCFGENDLYNILEPGENSFGQSFQLWLKRVSGFTIPFFHARGIFNYDFGLLPYRRDVNIVIGEPIIVPFLPSASSAEIDKYHNLYVAGLRKIFADNKGKFKNADGRDYKFNIVE
ncbi:hypothetical protein WICPIJ_005445 [Wickerhamomyces pijperi]|uniref:Diacylglycerol O-acyltransferase n=1 Tax=Wickerhamomyces pijperi TaxID=599730 RepID=A0A9P8TL47_WICPI|nr:hypothetical protein WICPIJ_005445 [Wickerhamomyces pijperi]